MQIMNKSEKIIGIGEAVLLPDASMEISKSFENNSVIRKLLAKGKLVEMPPAELPADPPIEPPAETPPDPPIEPPSGKGGKGGAK